MYRALWFGLVVYLVTGVAALNEGIYRDPDTKLTFYQSFRPYKLEAGRGITYRAAVPNAEQRSVYDIVVQMVIPNEVGWAGLTWGGTMINNPLLVIWRSSNNRDVVASSRWASTHTAPSTYTAATYTVYKTGTKSNSTHWQATVKCSGCASWTNQVGASRYVNPKDNNTFGWAYSFSKPSNPSSNTSSIPIHEHPNYVTLNLGQAANQDFHALIQSL